MENIEDVKDNQNMPEETKETEHVLVEQSSGDDISISDTSKTTQDDDTRRTQPYQSRYDGEGYSDEHSQYGRDNDRGMGYGGERRGGIRKFRKYDKIATRKLDINYKKPDILQEFLTEQGKILSRQITGNSAQNQRRLVREVKRARYLGFLPSA